MSQTPTTEPTRPDSEAIRVLLREALSELQRDHLKKELLEEIRVNESHISLKAVAGHPAFLLFIGFILTGVIGTLMTSSWQKREWDRQQARLIQIRRIEQKEKIMEALTQAVADSNAAEKNVLIAFTPDWRMGDPRREDITTERLEAWRTQGGREWRVATELIRAKLSFYFTDKSRNELLGIFDGLLTRRDNLATEMFGMESKYKNDKNIRSDLSFNKKLWEIDAEINKNRDDVRRMIEIILKDIQGDVAAPETRGG